MTIKVNNNNNNNNNNNKLIIVIIIIIIIIISLQHFREFFTNYLSELTL